MKRPFNNRRKGANVSRHLNKKSNAFLYRKLKYLNPSIEGDVKTANICLGILKSRGETI